MTDFPKTGSRNMAEFAQYIIIIIFIIIIIIDSFATPVKFH